MNLKNRDFISLVDFNKEELEHILELAVDIKNNRNGQNLANKFIGLLFSVASTRTRISFQRGIKQFRIRGIQVDETSGVADCDDDIVLANPKIEQAAVDRQFPV